MHGPPLPAVGYCACIAVAAPASRHRAGPVLRVAREAVDAFRANDLLSYASAIAFQVVFTTLPMLLVALAAMGFAGLSETWTVEVSPKAREALAPDTFSVLDRTVRSVLTEKRALWLTLGLAITLFKVSSTIRVTAAALNRLYGLDEHRPWPKRLLGSLLVAAVVLPCALVGLAGVVVGGELAAALGLGGAATAAVWVLRWLVVVALLLATVWLVLRVAPASRPQLHYVSLGAGIVVAGWIVATLAYGVYATELASYESVFGSLATVVVLITYAYILALVFLAGVQLDACLRRRMGDDDRVAD